jgi:hypothetical protein
MSRPNTPGYSIRRPPLGSGTSSRAGTPLGKPVISLEEWEARSPLSDEQVQSITFVRDQFSERKLPDKVDKLLI